MRDLFWRTALAAVVCLGVAGSRQSTMPEVVPSPPVLPAEEPFTDMSFGQRWYDGAQYGYRRGIIRGVTENSFGAELTATRAMAATMLWRMAGEPEAQGESRFADIGPKKYYTTAVIWGERQGLWKGYSDGTFRPDAAVTWGQLELVLGRYPGPEEEAAYPVGMLLSAGEKRKTALNRGELAQTLMELWEDTPEL